MKIRTLRSKMKKQKKQREINAVEQVAKMGDCDAVMCESQGKEEGVIVSPYSSKDGKWVYGLGLLTDWDEVLRAKVKKVCRKDDKIAMRKLGDFYKGAK